MRRLTIIRHALTDWNASGRFQGHTDRPLSAEGEAQARRLAGARRRLGPVDRVVSSPLERSLATARIVFPDVPIETDERLRELNFGGFEGGTLEENLRHPAWQWWYADPFCRRTPGGESYQDLRARVVAWFEELPADPHIVAVSHSGTIQMLLSHVLGVERPRWRKRFFLRHTGITRLLLQEGEILIERVNDTQHLETPDPDPFRD